MLIHEFGIDHSRDTWKQALAAGRRRWREHQLHAAVNDNPSIAADKLRELGYSVEWPTSDAEPASNTAKLERF